MLERQIPAVDDVWASQRNRQSDIILLKRSKYMPNVMMGEFKSYRNVCRDRDASRPVCMLIKLVPLY